MARIRNKGVGGVLVASTLALALGVGGLFVFNNKEKLGNDLDKVLTLEQDLNNANEEITSLKNQMSEKESLITNLRATNNTLYARVVELEAAWGIEKDNSAEQKAYYEGEILRLNTTIEENNLKISTLEAEVSELENYVLLLESDKTNLEDSVARYESANAVLESEKATLESEKTSLQGQVTNLTAENDSLTTDLANMTTERDEYKALYEEYYAKYNELLNNGGEQNENVDVSIWRARDLPTEGSTYLKHNVDFYILTLGGEVVEAGYVCFDNLGEMQTADYQPSYEINEDGTVTLLEVTDTRGNTLSNIVLEPEEFSVSENEKECLKYTFNGTATSSGYSYTLQSEVNFMTGVVKFYVYDVNNSVVGACAYTVLEPDESGNYNFGEMVGIPTGELSVSKYGYLDDERTLHTFIYFDLGETSLQFNYPHFTGMVYDSITIDNAA